MNDSWISIVRAHRRGLVDDLALVLAAEGIAYELQPRGQHWTLLVPLERFGDAAAVLRAYEDEGNVREEEPHPGSEYGVTQVGVVTGLVLLAFHAWVALSGDPMSWLRPGRASAARILDGELWRCLTALTLHAGPFHVASNAVAIAVFGNFLGRAVGPGVTLWVLLLSGGIGNFLNNLWRGGLHLSIGASTAVFGLVGTLAALQARRYQGIPRLSRRSWVPLAGAVGLLAMLGASPESDFIAHLAGLLAGVFAGAVIHPLAQRPLPPRSQLALSAAGVALMVVAWAVAFYAHNGLGS